MLGHQQHKAAAQQLSEETPVDEDKKKVEEMELEFHIQEIISEDTGAISSTVAFAGLALLSGSCLGIGPIFGNAILLVLITRILCTFQISQGGYNW